MEDTAQSDINNVTSGKGNVTSATGLLVLASNQTTQRYWHHYKALGGGGGGNVAPVCSNRSLTWPRASRQGPAPAPATCTQLHGLKGDGTGGPTSHTAAPAGLR